MRLRYFYKKEEINYTVYCVNVRYFYFYYRLFPMKLRICLKASLSADIVWKMILLRNQE